MLHITSLLRPCKFNSTNFDGNHRPKLDYFPPFAPYLGKCLPLARNFDWAKHSKQDVIFLKLEFSKAYDKISWTFLFDVLEKFGLALKYINMIHILFVEVERVLMLLDPNHFFPSPMWGKVGLLACSSFFHPCR
jgi:hypothetical protein